jgi:predicted DCC family thiol-disulfide oxidoreductase YuxK
MRAIAESTPDHSAPGQAVQWRHTGACRRRQTGQDLRMAGGDLTRGGPARDADGPIVLYDGDCGFCAKSVRWILAHEGDHAIRFAPLQGATAAELRRRYPRIPIAIDSVVYVSDGRAHLRSKAMLHAAHHLRVPWRWGHALRWLPAVVFDLGYRLIAAVRYRIWGRADACQLVTPEQRLRFLP